MRAGMSALLGVALGDPAEFFSERFLELGFITVHILLGLAHRKGIVTSKGLATIAVFSTVGALILIAKEGRTAYVLMLAAVLVVVAIEFMTKPPRKLLRIFRRYQDLPAYVTSLFATPGTGDVEEVTGRLLIGTNAPWIHAEPRTVVDGRDASSRYRGRRARRPYVFLKMKPRVYLPWLDASYYLLLRDLKHRGFKPVIYLYDFAYRLIDTPTFEVQPANDVLNALTKTEAYIDHLVGCGVEVIRGSSYFDRRRHSQSLYNFLYAEVFPEVARQVEVRAKTASEPDNAARELLFELHGYPTVLVAKHLCEVRPVYALQWEGRADKWRLVTQGEEVTILKTRTLHALGGRVRISKNIHLTDNDTKLKQKLLDSEQLGGDSGMGLMCSLLLYNTAPARYDWHEFAVRASHDEILKSVKEQREGGFLIGDAAVAAEKAMQASEPESTQQGLNAISELPKSYLRLAVYKGVKDFQAKFGLTGYVN